MANILKSGSWVRISQKDGSIDIGCVDSTPMKNGEGKTAYGVTNLAGKRNIITKDRLTRIKHISSGKLADATKARFLKEIEESKRLAENANKVKEADEKIREHNKLQETIKEKDQEIEHLKRSLSEANQKIEELNANMSVGVPQDKIKALNKGLKKAMMECSGSCQDAFQTLLNTFVEFNEIPIDL